MAVFKILVDAGSLEVKIAHPVELYAELPKICRRKSPTSNTSPVFLFHYYFLSLQFCVEMITKLDRS